MISRRDESSYQHCKDEGDSVSSKHLQAQGHCRGSGSHEQQCHGHALPEEVRKDHVFRHMHVNQEIVQWSKQHVMYISGCPVETQFFKIRIKRPNPYKQDESSYT